MKKGIEKIILNGAILGALTLSGCATSNVISEYMSPQARSERSEVATRTYEATCIKDLNETIVKNSGVGYNLISRCAASEKKKVHFFDNPL